MDVHFYVFGEAAQEMHNALRRSLALLFFSGLGDFRGAYHRRLPFSDVSRFDRYRRMCVVGPALHPKEGDLPTQKGRFVPFGHIAAGTWGPISGPLRPRCRRFRIRQKRRFIPREVESQGVGG